MSTCRYCGGAGGKDVNKDENCSKCKGIGRVTAQGKDVYCSRCFGRGTVTATVWEACSCQKGGCFPEGTMVMTPAGQAEISTLKPGDKVKVYDPAQAAFPERAILGVLKYRSRRALRLTFANATCLRMTPNHNILVEGKWLRASAIKEGAIVSTLEKDTAANVVGKMEVIDIGDGGSWDVVYNPIVENSFTVIANGVITHNFDQFKRAKMICWGLYGRLAHASYTEP